MEYPATKSSLTKPGKTMVHLCTFRLPSLSTMYW